MFLYKNVYDELLKQFGGDKDEIIMELLDMILMYQIEIDRTKEIIEEQSLIIEEYVKKVNAVNHKKSNNKELKN